MLCKTRRSSGPAAGQVPGKDFATQIPSRPGPLQSSERSWRAVYPGPVPIPVPASQSSASPVIIRAFSGGIAFTIRKNRFPRPKARAPSAWACSAAWSELLTARKP